MMKCKICSAMAVWYYVPVDFDRLEDDRYFCDNCVHRGCSCNKIPSDDPDNYEEYRDDQGRELPCCEYDYNENGFEDDWLDCKPYEGN